MAFITFLVALVATILRGYVLSVFWDWFVITQFHGLPRLGLLAAIGLSFVASIFSEPHFSYVEHKLDKSERESFDLFKAAVTIVWLLLSLAGGYIVHCLM